MKRSIKVALHTSWCGTTGQLLTLDFGSFFLPAVYRLLEVEAVTKQLSEALWAGRPRQPWLMMVGDFNWSPDSNPWLPLPSNRDATAVGAGNAEGNFAPTRWEGHEFLDYALTSIPHCSAHLEYVKWGDHIPVILTLNLHCDDATVHRLLPTPRFSAGLVECMHALG